MRLFFSLALIGLITSYSAQECPDGYIEDCNGNCAPSAWGPDDGYCDDGSASFNLELTLENGYIVWCEGCEEEGYVAIYFNCEEFNWDGGDCETGGEGGDCPDGYILDCNGNCAPLGWIQDGFCDDGTYSFNLELTLENGYVVWCEGCEEEGYVAVYFNCEEFNWDGGDCETDEEGGCLSDVNQDGYISIEDILLVLSDFGNTCE